MDKDELSRALGEATEGLTVLEKVLLLAEVMREVYGGERVVIEARMDGGFSIIRKKED